MITGLAVWDSIRTDASGRVLSYTSAEGNGVDTAGGIAIGIIGVNFGEESHAVVFNGKVCCERDQNQCSQCSHSMGAYQCV